MEREKSAQRIEENPRNGEILLDLLMRVESAGQKPNGKTDDKHAHERHLVRRLKRTLAGTDPGLAQAYVHLILLKRVEAELENERRIGGAKLEMKRKAYGRIMGREIGNEELKKNIKKVNMVEDELGAREGGKVVIESSGTGEKEVVIGGFERQRRKIGGVRLTEHERDLLTLLAGSSLESHPSEEQLIDRLGIPKGNTGEKAALQNYIFRLRAKLPVGLQIARKKKKWGGYYLAGEWMINGVQGIWWEKREREPVMVISPVERDLLTLTEIARMSEHDAGELLGLEEKYASRLLDSARAKESFSR